MTPIEYCLRLCCLTALAFVVSGQYLPTSPCPKIFQYENDGRQWFGTIQVPSSSLDSRAKLSLKMLLGFRPQTKHLGSIELKKDDIALTRDGYQVFNYIVHFPKSRFLPKVINITFNGKLLCSGDTSESFTSAAGKVIDLSLEHAINQNAHGLDTIVQSDKNNSPESVFVNQIFNNQNSLENFEINNFVRRKRQTEDWLALAKQLKPNRDRAPMTYSSGGKSVIVRTAEDDRAVSDFLNSLPQGSVAKPRPETKPLDVINRNEPGSGQSVSTVDFECGVSFPSQLFVHGKGTYKGDWPWLVALLRTTGADPEFYCGSTLISSRHVITAAHCTRNGDNNALSTSDFVVLVGAFNIVNWRSDPDVTQTGLAKIISHPRYIGGTNTLNDIAVLVLDKTISFSNTVKPACLWTYDTDQKYLSVGTIAGWGRDENGLRNTPEPREGQVPIVSQEVCRGSRVEFYQLTSDRTVCAGAKNGVGPCNGDSGSGLFVARENKWYLRGIVSTSLQNADRSCNLREYVVFADAAKYRKWIENIMRDNP